jgi:Co/Zn/Cd efflux system component
MFLVEAGAGLAADSVSLQADALDFLGDAANYGISLFVLAMSLRRRASAALLKAASMALFGVWVMSASAFHAVTGTVPEPMVMTLVGLLALATNVGVALMLWRWRIGDSNMRSVWLCSRNDAIGNVAVLAAAAGVFGTGSGWPDLVVAAIMASLALSSAVRIAVHARSELQPA